MAAGWSPAGSKPAASSKRSIASVGVLRQLVGRAESLVFAALTTRESGRNPVSLAVSQRCQRVKPSPTMPTASCGLRAQGRDVIVSAPANRISIPRPHQEAGIEPSRGGQVHQRRGPALRSNHRQVPAGQRPDLRRRPILVSAGRSRPATTSAPPSEPGRRNHRASALGVLSRHGQARRRRAGISARRRRLQDHAARSGSGDHATDRLLFLNSPSNPTGAAYTRSELETRQGNRSIPRSSSAPTCTNTSTGPTNPS